MPERYDTPWKVLAEFGFKVFGRSAAPDNSTINSTTSAHTTTVHLPTTIHITVNTTINVSSQSTTAPASSCLEATSKGDPAATFGGVSPSSFPSSSSHTTPPPPSTTAPTTSEAKEKASPGEIAGAVVFVVSLLMLAIIFW